MLLFAIALFFSSMASAQTVVRLGLTKTTLLAGEEILVTPILVSGTLPSRDFTLTASPSVGTISRRSPSAFSYTAPSQLSQSLNVTLSLRITGLSAPVTAVITLSAPAPAPAPAPIPTLAVSPGSATLGSGSSIRFTALANSVPTSAVQWQISPQIGTIGSDGTYYAPSTITSSGMVMISARLSNNTAVSASAIVQLQAPAAPTITVLPSNANLGPGSRIKLTAYANGTATSAVTWRMNPSIGVLLSDGNYVAPSSLAAPVDVLVTAQSTTFSTAQATATLRLAPPVNITLSPSSSTISAGAQVRLTPTVTGTTNTQVTWQFSPALGTLNAGLYTAPASVAQNTTVQVTATSVADASRVASATITITPAALTSAITLPIEVLGANGTTMAADFNLDAAALPTVNHLYLRIHGLDYQEEGSFQINAGPWIPLNNANYLLNNPDRIYGGIGGGFATLQGRVAVQTGWLRSGVNTIRFRFNATDGFTHGFRILAFNFRNASGVNLLPATAFQEVDPSTWRAPYTDSASIERGKWLWYNATLSTPLSPQIKAKCADCHTQSGRDLKYFAYSNHSIRTRAQFHGLSSTDGDLIASYIRSLPGGSPGRPWNPPYQPGPGLDARPISEWAAGAGIDAVLTRDRDTLGYVFPNGFTTTKILPTGDLSIREAPISIQLPDWNHWLPQIHPKDAFPGFDQSEWNQTYLKIRSILRPGQASTLLSIREIHGYWGTQRWNFVNNGLLSLPEGADKNRKHYAAHLWQIVKRFELNQDFDLEGLIRAWSGPQADDRAWISADAFGMSPVILKIPGPITPGLRNGAAETYNYLAYVWYHLQLVTNHSQKVQENHDPIDWPYAYGSVLHMNRFRSHGALFVLWLSKALQISENGIRPTDASKGWRLDINNIFLSTEPDLASAWNDLSTEERRALFTVLWRNWLNKVRSFAPSEFVTGKQVNPSEVPSVPLYTQANRPSGVLNAIRVLKSYGVEPSLIREVADWAKAVWPNYNWYGEL